MKKAKIHHCPTVLQNTAVRIFLKRIPHPVRIRISARKSKPFSNTENNVVFNCILSIWYVKLVALRLLLFFHPRATNLSSYKKIPRMQEIHLLARTFSPCKKILPIHPSARKFSPCKKRIPMQENYPYTRKSSPCRKILTMQENHPHARICPHAKNSLLFIFFSMQEIILCARIFAPAKNSLF